jgi:hypothetical protein
VRSLVLVMVVLAGCVSDADGPQPTGDERIVEVSIEEVALAPDEATGPDVCAMAAALPTDDVCSLMCDPVAMAARLTEEGMAAGRCYQLRCELPGIDPILVGVCLAP